MSSSPNTPLHERFAALGWIRAVLRRAVVGLLGKTLATDDGRALAAAALNGLLADQHESWRDSATHDLPYPDLGQPQLQTSPARRSDTIIITGRFRSGSTLLWNLFRHVDGCTSYYEPLNERRWFDSKTRGRRVDATHRNVDDYWKEYDGLEDLGAYYQERWIDRALLMGPSAWDADLKRYVERLIQAAPGRPVLQFNRIDFRLPWFRKYFPAARVVHLYRHPRDQWCSSLMDAACFPFDANPEEFARHDKFYLLSWARDLKYHFPFLSPSRGAHPYRIFYFIWKLSFAFGRKYAHHSLSFEDLVNDPDEQLPRLLEAVQIESYDLDRLKRLVVKPELGKWRSYATDDWFRRHEEECETVLAEFLGQVPALPG